MKKNLTITLKVFVISFLLSIGIAYSDYETVTILDLLNWSDILVLFIYALSLTIIIMMLSGFFKLILFIVRKLKK